MSRRLVFAVLAILIADAALAHSWYPLECCSAYDCAPATKVVPDDKGGFYITTEHGTVHVPANYTWRLSHDGEYHVCMRAGPLSSETPTLLCAFEPALS